MRISRAAAAAALSLLLGGCRESPDPSIGPGRLVRAGGEAGRSLSALVPAEAHAGEIFRRQPDGAAGLLVLGTGLTRGDTIRWNGRPLKTTFGNSRLITAAVAPELLASPGVVEVVVEDAIDPSRPRLRARFRVLAP